jgi:hypothetical protein
MMMIVRRIAWRAMILTETSGVPWAYLDYQILKLRLKAIQKDEEEDGEDARRSGR